MVFTTFWPVIGSSGLIGLSTLFEFLNSGPAPHTYHIHVISRFQLITLVLCKVMVKTIVVNMKCIGVGTSWVACQMKLITLYHKFKDLLKHSFL